MAQIGAETKRKLAKPNVFIERELWWHPGYWGPVEPGKQLSVIVEYHKLSFKELLAFLQKKIRKVSPATKSAFENTATLKKTPLKQKNINNTSVPPIAKTPNTSKPIFKKDIKIPFKAAVAAASVKSNLTSETPASPEIKTFTKTPSSITGFGKKIVAGKIVAEIQNHVFKTGAGPGKAPPNTHPISSSEEHFSEEPVITKTSSPKLEKSIEKEQQSVEPKAEPSFKEESIAEPNRELSHFLGEAKTVEHELGSHHKEFIKPEQESSIVEPIKFIPERVATKQDSPKQELPVSSESYVETKPEQHTPSEEITLSKPISKENRAESEFEQYGPPKEDTPPKPVITRDLLIRGLGDSTEKREDVFNPEIRKAFVNDKDPDTPLTPKEILENIKKMRGENHGMGYHIELGHLGRIKKREIKPPKVSKTRSPNRQPGMEQK